MSWGRQDDGYWDHPKTVALIEQGDAGLAAAGAFWVINSYCLRKQRGEVTVWEIAMLLRRPQDEAEAVIAPLLVAPDGFEHGFLLRKQTRSYLVNSFDEYRSKNEAKAEAGSKGGEKSGETRRSKSKQTRSKGEANDEAKAKQTRTPETRDPRPDPDPDPETREFQKNESGSWITSSVAEAECRSRSWSWPTTSNTKALGAIGRAFPCQREIYDAALLETSRNAGTPGGAYLASTILGMLNKQEKKEAKRPDPGRHPMWDRIFNPDDGTFRDRQGRIIEDANGNPVDPEALSS